MVAVIDLREQYGCAWRPHSLSRKENRVQTRHRPRARVVTLKVSPATVKIASDLTSQSRRGFDPLCGGSSSVIADGVSIPFVQRTRGFDPLCCPPGSSPSLLAFNAFVYNAELGGVSIPSYYKNRRGDRNPVGAGCKPHHCNGVSIPFAGFDPLAVSSGGSIPLVCFKTNRGFDPLCIQRGFDPLDVF